MLSVSKYLAAGIAGGVVLALAPLTPASAASGITSVTLSPTTYAGGASHVGWTVGFIATTALTTSDTVTVSGPSGTAFPNADGIVQVTDGAQQATVDSHPSGTSTSVGVPFAVAAGDAVTLVIGGVTNPDAGDNASAVGVSTSKDTAVVHPAAHAFATAQAVGGVTVATAPTTAGGASYVTWTVGFTASSTGALVTTEGDNGRITVTGPAGTVFPNNCGEVVTDLTTGATSKGQAAETCDGPSNGNLSGTVQVIGAVPIHPGDQVQVVIPSMVNPAGGTDLDQVSVTTSSDTVAAHPAASTPVPAAQPVSDVTFSTTNALGGGRGSWVFGFTASSTGAVTDAVNGQQDGAFVFITPAGTVLPNACGETVTDVTTGKSDSSTCDNPSGQTGAVPVPADVAIHPGDRVRVTVTSMTNPPAGTKFSTVTVATTSDTVPVAVTTAGAFETSATIAGKVSYNGSGLGDALVEACDAAQCYSADTAGDGTYSVSVGANASWTVTAFGRTGNDGQPTTYASPVAVTTGTVSGIDITQTTPAPLPAGGTFSQSGTTSSGATSVFWGSPSTLSLTSDAFPAGETALVTSVDVVGIDEYTGQLAYKESFPGQSYAGGYTPVASNQTLTIPALAPIHGGADLYVHYTAYPSGVNPPSGISAPQHVELAPQQTATFDVGNVGYPAGVTIGAGPIDGPSAADFHVVSQSVSPEECLGETVMQANSNGGAGAPSYCGISVSWTPPAGTTQCEYATEHVLIGGHGDVLVNLDGCPGGGGPNGPNGDGAGGAGGGGGSYGGGLYIDPSGVVTSGGVPLAGATVTLLQGPGNYQAVPNGSAVMSPSNRTNPDTTDAQGQFGWDVVPGSYEVQATRSGCGTATAGPFDVPPPVDDLALDLTCTTPPTQAVTSTALTANNSAVALGTPVRFTATVTGASPTGTVTFTSGATTLGTAALDPGGVASLSVATLPPGSSQITAAYSGDGLNQASSAMVVESVTDLTAPPAPAPPAATTTTLSASPAKSAAYGKTVTYKAIVSPTPDGGTVVFTEKGKTLCAAAVSGGVATCAVKKPAVGTHAVTATFTGTPAYAASAASISEKVTALKLSLKVTVTSRKHAKVTFAIKAGTLPVKETVLLEKKSGKKWVTIGKVTLGTNGKGTLKGSRLPVGRISLRVVVQKSATAVSVTKTVTVALL